jgi:hypothetical protein
MHTLMSKWIKVCAVIAAIMAAPGAKAFSLLGPLTSWQVNGLAYGFGGDLGGPMNISEGFRWNVPVITYACDKSFIDYFGARGVKEIDKAFQYFDDLPRSRDITDLNEFSTSTLREHGDAATLGIIDIKSTAMSLIMEELGFADPIRYTFTLRSRLVTTVNNRQFTNYVAIMRNFDPVTLAPSRYVNGTLYTFEIREFNVPFQHADALEAVRFGNDDETLPVATGLARIKFLDNVSDSGPAGTISSGLFRTGLTRDDVGGIKFLYDPKNLAVEGLLPNVTQGFGLGRGNTWIPFTGITNQVGVSNIVIGGGGGTNGTNLVVSQGLRGGRNKLRFQRVFFDSIFGQTFTPITNAYTDVLIGTNFDLVVQAVQRGITAPDFIFVAEDLGLAGNLIPALTRRSDTTGWVDNDAINGVDETTLSHGPGVIAPPIRISFSDQLPYFETGTDVAFLDEFPNEDSSFFSGVWGSFDGTTNAPVIYTGRQTMSLNQLRREVLGRNRSQ